MIFIIEITNIESVDGLVQWETILYENTILIKINICMHIYRVAQYKNLSMYWNAYNKDTLVISPPNSLIGKSHSYTTRL